MSVEPVTIHVISCSCALIDCPCTCKSVQSVYKRSTFQTFKTHKHGTPTDTGHPRSFHLGGRASHVQMVHDKIHCFRGRCGIVVVVV